MINKNHVAQIRTCQRIKFDQALYILTMYQKKIRTEIKFDANHQVVDADKQYDQKIVRSWNQKWKMDLTKPLLNCVTSVHPRIILDIADKQNQQMMQENQIERYNRTILQFIRRMRAQHEDQSNFKFVEIDINQKNQKMQKFKGFAAKSCKDFCNAITNMLNGMKNSIVENGSDLQIQQQQGDNYFLQIGSRIQDMLQVVKNTSQSFINQKLCKLISYCVSIFDSLKQSDFGSTLITIQPCLQEFTYLLHPLFLPIYASYLKQQDQLKAKIDARQKKEPQDPNFPFKNFFNSNTTSLSKVVFVNLDGYQSQFNLQFARCFRRNMLYISFPKQDVHYQNDMNSVYEQRLYKKIMYNWQKNKMRFNTQSMDEQLNQADKMYFLTHNIQSYFTNVQNNLYNGNGHEDLNRNTYIFPLRLSTLNQNFTNLVPQDQNDTIQVYESYAILQIFKYYLVNQIKQFGPTYIIISNSGRLNIEDNHFVQIMQQLTKLSHYKLIYFPNLTTRFTPQKNHIDHQLNLNGIDYLLRKQSEIQMQNKQQQNISYDFFNKISRFLKVSSGTHSLVKNFQEQDTVSKHRNLKVLKRINKLMQVLGNQYQNVQRIRFKNSQIDLIPKLYEKDTQKIMKAFDKLIPGFYNQLYLLLQSIISVCYLSTIQPKCLAMLTKYNISPQKIKNNYIIKQLIYFIQSKIIVRNVRNQADKQILSFDKIKKYLNCQRQKHFLQISEQKYQDSVLIYFKTLTNAQIYDNVIEGKPNFSGLIDISFANPNKQIKDCMHIYDTTQILYKIDQANGNGPIPLLIMNHLPLQRKSVSKFDNYCAFLKRQAINQLNNYKNGDQGIQKIYEQKKLKPYIIKFFDQENNQIIQNRFQFRTQWNYCQTQNYMILYWPTLFNFVEAVSFKLQGRTYEAPLLNQFFISKRQVSGDAVCFYKANTPDDLAPRTGCSTYQFRDFVYILGGFYDRQNNYLSLQRDVTVLNLSMYTHDGHRKLQAANMKNQLYQSIVKQNNNENRVNSYVRPRRQFQFYDMQDLGVQHQIQQGYKFVAMIGGVGQNFIHPFSLLTYYYYILKIDLSNGRLVSIKRNIVYNRSIPVNVRKPSKNMGIIKTPIRNKNQINGKTIGTKPQLTEPFSYARFRIVYKIQGNQLKYKFQYVFSEKDCKMLKQQLRKYQEQSDSDELVSFRIQKIQGTNHQFIIQKFGTKQVVHLRFETTQNTTSQQRQQQVKLTHDSVTHMNVINGNYVFAIIKHANFTNGRSVLADCFVKNIENQNQSQDQASYVCLKPFYTDIKFDISLHIIEASNMNLIYILHGHRLYNSDKIYQFQITHNKNKKTKIVTQIKPKKQLPQLMDKSIPICCYSTFYYKRTQQKNQIFCQSYLTFEEDKNVITRVNQYFDPSDVNNLCWNVRYPIMKYVFCLQKSNTPISLQRTTFLEFYRQEKIRIIVVEYNKKKYMARIEEDQSNMAEYVRVQLQLASDLLINNLEQNQFEKGTILIKKLQNYEDRGYQPSK